MSKSIDLDLSITLPLPKVQEKIDVQAVEWLQMYHIIDA